MNLKASFWTRLNRLEINEDLNEVQWISLKLFQSKFPWKEIAFCDKNEKAAPIERKKEEKTFFIFLTSSVYVKFLLVVPRVEVDF